MAGQWIDIAAADGGSFKGYLTVPASGSGPGILLLQEIFGVNSSMREVADYYAEEGYVVLSEPLRDYVITSDCRGDDGDESLMLITHVHAHPEDGRPGVAAGSLLAG